MSLFPPAPTSYAAPTYEQRVDAPTRYRPTGGWATFVITFLLMGMLTDVIAILSTWAEIGMLQNIVDGVAVSKETMESSDVRQALFGLTQIGVLVPTGVLFLVWLWRSYANLEAISRWTPRHGPGWAIGSWFTPFLNFVRPYQIVRETWWVSANHDLADDLPSGYTPPGSMLLGLWWAAWVASSVLGQASFRMSLRAKSPSELLTVSYGSVLTDATSILAAILLLAIVASISSRQQAAARARGLAAA